MRKGISLFCIITLGVINSIVLAQDIQRSNHHMILISHPDSHMIDSSTGWSNHFFKKIKKGKSYKEARRGLLLNNGTLLFYFEESRPATKEEKIKRAQEFNRRWKELEKRAKITLPGTKKRLEDITGGFGYQSPGWFTQNWSYLLLSIKDHGLELWQPKF